MKPHYAVHFDQKFIGSFDTYDNAKKVVDERSSYFERIATVRSGADTVDVYICRPHEIVNYAYASITICEQG